MRQLKSKIRTRLLGSSRAPQPGGVRPRRSRIRSDILPASLPPRGLSREEAAAYIGVGATKFDQLVQRGDMPGPKRIDGRKVWDRRRLDSAFDALPSEDEFGSADSDPWSHVRV
jgi:hypothetical protein